MVITFVGSDMYMNIYIIFKYRMYKSNKYYKCTYMYTLQLYILMFMCYAYTLMSEYVKERKENDVINDLEIVLNSVFVWV